MRICPEDGCCKDHDRAKVVDRHLDRIEVRLAEIERRLAGEKV